MHEILNLLVDRDLYIPVELRQIRRVLPALYEGFWAIDVVWPGNQDNRRSTTDSLVALDKCEVSLWIMYDIIRCSCAGLPATPTPSEATSFHGLESLSAAKRLVKQIHATLSSLPQRQRPESLRTSRAHEREEKSQGLSTSSQAWKYVCTGTGGQYNSVQEGNGHQTVTNAHKMYTHAKRSD